MPCAHSCTNTQAAQAQALEAAAAALQASLTATLDYISELRLTTNMVRCRLAVNMRRPHDSLAHQNFRGHHLSCSSTLAVLDGQTLTLSHETPQVFEGLGQDQLYVLEAEQAYQQCLLERGRVEGLKRYFDTKSPATKAAEAARISAAAASGAPSPSPSGQAKKRSLISAFGGVGSSSATTMTEWSGYLVGGRRRLLCLRSSLPCRCNVFCVPGRRDRACAA